MPVGLVYKNSAGELESISIDATLTEQHTARVDVTEHPVESGANTTDHVRKKPAALKLDCIVTDYPIPGSPTFGPVLAAEGRAKEIHETLERLQAAGALLEVHTSLKVYENMVIEELPVTRDAKTGKRALKFTLTLREIRLTDSRTVTAKITKVTKAQGKSKGGKQDGTEATEQERKKSWALQIAEGTGLISPTQKKAPVK